MAGKILVADDITTARPLFEKLLRALHYEPVFASNGREAVEMFSRHPNIVLILMDIRMPEMDGLEAARSIRRTDPGGLTVPIIAISAMEGEQAEREAKAAGINAFIHKPIDPRRLIEAIRGLVKTP